MPHAHGEADCGKVRIEDGPLDDLSLDLALELGPNFRSSAIHTSGPELRVRWSSTTRLTPMIDVTPRFEHRGALESEEVHVPSITPI
jgi:hypothetical protein